MSMHRKSLRVEKLLETVMAHTYKQPECGETPSNSYSGTHAKSVTACSQTVLSPQWYKLGRWLYTPFALPVYLRFPKYLAGNVHAVTVTPD